MRAFVRRNFKKVILPIAVIVICLTVVIIVFIVVLNNINAKQALVIKKELEVKELASLCEKYQSVLTFNNKMGKRIAKDGANFELLSFLEDISKKVGINEKISSMKPAIRGPDEISASLVLKNINMEELKEYLDKIINSDKMLLVKKMFLKVIETKQRSLEASFVITTLKPLQHSAS